MQAAAAAVPASAAGISPLPRDLPGGAACAPQTTDCGTCAPTAPWRRMPNSSIGAAMTVEMGGNRVLTGMVKRIDKEIEPLSVGTPAELEAWAKAL